MGFWLRFSKIAIRLGGIFHGRVLGPNKNLSTPRAAWTLARTITLLPSFHRVTVIFPEPFIFWENGFIVFVPFQPGLDELPMLFQQPRILAALTEFLFDNPEIVHKVLAVKVPAQQALRCFDISVRIVDPKRRILLQLLENFGTDNDAWKPRNLVFERVAADHGRT